MSNEVIEKRFSVFRHGFFIVVLLAMLCTVADYFVCNMSYPVFDSSSKLSLLGWHSRCHNSIFDANLLKIDVGYDKQLVPVIDSDFGDTIGSRVITDRYKLLSFLQKIDSADYSYLFFDLRFERGDMTPYDSALFARLISTPRLSISTHRPETGFEIADTALLSCANFNDYRHLRSDNFSRYELLQDGYRSAAMAIYEKTCGAEIKQYGPIFTMRGRLCYNSIFLPLTNYHSEYRKIDDDKAEINCLTLGYQILNNMTDEEIRKLVKNKIVVLGDFEEDIHLTYAGEEAGPMLTYYAYRELTAGNQYVSWSYMICLFLLYLGLGLTIISDEPPHKLFFDRVGLTNDNKTGFTRQAIRVSRFLISLIGFSCATFLATLLFYVIWGASLQLIVPTTVFGLLSLIVAYKKSIK